MTVFRRRRGSYLTASSMLVGSSGIIIPEPEPPPFSPADISGRVADVDMLDAASFTNSAGFVSAVTNRASGAVWPVASFRPAVGSSGGRTYMAFDGVDDRIINAEAPVLQALAVGSEHTIFYVAEFETLFDDAAVLATGNSASNLGIRSWGQNTTGEGLWALTTLPNSGPSVTTSSTAKPQPGMHVHCWRSSAAQQVSRQINDWIADPDNAAHAPGATTSDRFALGCRPRSSPTLFWRGKFGALLIYNRRLTDAECTQVVSYLRTRWTITPLLHVLTQGDSITAGSANGMPIAANLSVPGSIITNVAIGGRKAYEILTIDIDGKMSQFRSTGNVAAWLLDGTNDLANNGAGGYATPAQVLGYREASVAKMRALGMRVATGTILYRASSTWGNNPDFNTDVDTVNADIRANPGGKYGDAIVDTNAVMVAAGGISQYIDGTHPNATVTATALSPAVQVGLDSVLAMGFP